MGNHRDGAINYFYYYEYNHLLMRENHYYLSECDGYIAALHFKFISKNGTYTPDNAKLDDFLN